MTAHVRCRPASSVEIIVCVHNALNSVRRCLASLRRAAGPPVRLILVDDGSDPETATWLNRFASSRGNVLLVRNARAMGYTKAANFGLRTSSARCLVLLNSDTRVSDHWLTRLLECQRSRPTIGIVGPLSNAASWQSVPERFSADGDWSVNTLPPRMTVGAMAAIVDVTSSRTFPVVPFVNGFCLLIDRRVIERIGHFDEDAFGDGYGEEIDFCLRARDCGFESVVADHAFVYHAKSRSYGHAMRRLLSTRARSVLRLKYGNVRFDGALAALRNDPVLASRRAAVGSEFERRRLAGAPQA